MWPAPPRRTAHALARKIQATAYAYRAGIHHGRAHTHPGGVPPGGRRSCLPRTACRGSCPGMSTRTRRASRLHSSSGRAGWCGSRRRRRTRCTARREPALAGAGGHGPRHARAAVHLDGNTWHPVRSSRRTVRGVTSLVGLISSVPSTGRHSCGVCGNIRHRPWTRSAPERHAAYMHVVPKQLGTLRPGAILSQVGIALGQSGLGEDRSA